MDGTYATPRHVSDLADCYFYHTTDLPGLGRVEGEWDLRYGTDDYLGRVELMGRRVLEVGTASGFVCFHMERRGAEVVAYDRSPEHTPDVVPYARGDPGRTERELRTHIGRLNNAFWLGHRLFESQARLAHGTAYAVPQAIGPVDVAVFGCVLLHLRDPFAALASALRLTRQEVVIVEPVVGRFRWWRRLRERLAGPSMRFFPDPATGEPRETWWVLGPEVLRRFVAVLGFEDVTVRYHQQLFRGRPTSLVTVVARRTHGGEMGSGSGSSA
jgi:SAM-dependent methyltransferase